MQSMTAEKMVKNLKVGSPDVKLGAPAHVAGIREGNSPRRHAREETLGKPNRSTGINAKDRVPIDPRMPWIPPA